jgi:mycoketide-CoA synthase
MTGHLGEADLARMARSGVGALSSEQALELLDAARQHGGPHLLAVNLNLRTLAGQPPSSLPAALRALARGRARRTAAIVGAQPEDWAGRLAGLSAGERHRVVLNLVRGHVATVLGHADPEAVQAEASFKELGFDSLTAVELRNRLGSATGLRLPPALVFDYPQVGVLAAHLRQRISAEDGVSSGVPDLEPVFGELARLESTLHTAVLADGDSGAVTARLETLLNQWKAARAPENGGTTAERLRAASADQVLDFIDNELGAS